MGFLKSKLVLALLLPIIGWLGWSLTKIKLQNDIVNKEVVELESKAGDLESSNGYLRRLLSELSDSFLEREVRLKLNYKLPDEQAVFVHTSDGGIVSASGDFENLKPETPSYLKWWQWLTE